MSGLVTLAVGFLLVVLDLRLGGSVDVVPDPVGWAVALWALGGLSPLHRGFTVAAAASVVGLVSSLPEAVGAVSAPLAWLSIACQTVLVFATCTAVMALVPAERRRADALRWSDLATTVAVAALGALAGELGAAAAVPAVLAALAGVVVLVLFLLTLHRAARASVDLPRHVVPRGV